MRFLYICSNDIFSRHELGFLAALSEGHRVDVIRVGATISNVEKLIIISDNGIHHINLINLGLGSLPFRYADIIREKVDVEAYDAIFATPRLPIYVASMLSKKANVKVLLRLWSIRAAKLLDNLRYGAYGDLIIFPLSILNNLYMGSLSDATITVDDPTYQFARKIGIHKLTLLAKLYPPYGMAADLGQKSDVDGKVLSIIKDLDGYVLGFTTLNKRGAYLKFEARPHALIYLNIALKNPDLRVLVAGSTYDDFKKVFPYYAEKLPRNIHFIGRGFSDSVLETLYRKALLTIIPVTNRSISNRLLEALYFGSAIVTSPVGALLHPELNYMRALYVCKNNDYSWCVRNAMRHVDELRMAARNAYERYFSTRSNMLKVRKLLEFLSEG